MLKTGILISVIFTSCSSGAVPVVQTGVGAKAVARKDFDGKLKLGRGNHRDGGGFGVDGDGDKSQNEHRHTTQLSTKSKFSFQSLLNRTLAWGFTGAPVSLFDTSVGEGGEPAQDPVFILENPWVHPQDEVVASLQLPSPFFSNHDKATCPNNDSIYVDDYDETKYEALDDFDPTVDPKMSYPSPSPFTPFDSQGRSIHLSNPANRPLYLFELIALACMLKKAKPEYHVFSANCFWYCSMILHLVRLRHGLEISRIDGQVEPGPGRDTTQSATNSTSDSRNSTTNLGAADDMQGPTSEGGDEIKTTQSQIRKLGTRVKYAAADHFERQGLLSVPPLSPNSSIFSLSAFSSSSLSPQAFSWYSSKMGTWYGIRVSRTPTDRILKEWLVRAEEAVDRFMTEVALGCHMSSVLANTSSRAGSAEVSMLVADGFSGQSGAWLLVQLSRLAQLGPSVYGPSAYTASTLVDSWSGYQCSSSSLDIWDTGS